VLVRPRSVRAFYYVRVALIVGCQLALIAGIFYFGRSSVSVMHCFVTLALVVPFLACFVAFYGTPAFATSRHIHRVIVLSILFGVATVVSFWLCMFVVFTLFMAFGGHHW
jgi:hypothetical protein